MQRADSWSQAYSQARLEQHRRMREVLARLEKTEQSTRAARSPDARDQGAEHKIRAVAGRVAFGPPMPKPQVTSRDLIETCARLHGVSFVDIVSKRRTGNLARARHCTAWVLRHGLQTSMPWVGRRLGDRNHTTILHSVRWMDERLARDDADGDAARAVIAEVARRYPQIAEFLIAR